MPLIRNKTILKQYSFECRALVRLFVTISYMKRKHVVFLLLAVIVLAVIWVVLSKWQTFSPSQQMKDLRQLEASLDLPEPKYRNEEDRGLHRDGKGATHYDRRITLSYEDATVLDTLRGKLLSNSWQEKEVESLGAYKYFSFRTGEGDQMKCVNGHTKPIDSDGITLYISLQASGEYLCNPAPGV